MSSPEDRLTHDERLRLEALAQSVALCSMRPVKSAGEIIAYAKDFASFIAGGEVEHGD